MAVVPAFVGIVVAASPAAATGSAAISGGVLTYTGGSENNSVTLAVSATEYTFTDFGAGSTTAGAGCTSSNGPAGPMPILDCTRSGVTAIVIRTNGGDDVAQVELADVVPAGVTLTVELGAGNDSWTGHNGVDTVFGEAGNDRLRDDERGQDAPFLSPDVLLGGAGIDTADYSYRLSEASPLRLSLDRTANDGASGEGDNIGPDGSVESVIGGIENDIIIGSAAANGLRGLEGSDVISGGGGNDTLMGDSGGDRLNGGKGRDAVVGGFGNDTLIGGPGRDALSGGANNDVLRAKDGFVDAVACGRGTDLARVNGGDRVSLCEAVRR